ncbi:MAG: alpha-E domain-containing protein [Burkholderiales bacterium]
MLSRVASHLYWLSRYLERAENMARIIDVGHSLALLSGSNDDSGALELLVITDTLDAFRATGRPINAENVARFLAWDPALPSSIVNCLESSRENTRAVRGSVTSEMWETINDTWLQLQARRRSGREPVDSEFFDWVKERSHLFRGVTFATIRRDQPYQFIRLGTFVERADNTARILSVKQVVGQDESEDDYYRLSSVLRSVSSLEAYRDTYRDTIEARRVAQLLIFDPQLPRSLRSCFDEIERILAALPQESGRQARRLSAVIRAGLAHGDLDEVLGMGLREYLDAFLRDNNALGSALHSGFMEMR